MACGVLELLPSLFGQLIVPIEVLVELNDKAGAPEPAALLRLPSMRLEFSQPVPDAARDLDPGEQQAIACAVALGTGVVLLDERAARRVAAGPGLRVVGTLGVLVRLKRAALIPSVVPPLEALRRRGFHLGDAVVARARHEAGE